MRSRRPANSPPFLIACRRHGVTFKATAGLHHAMRGSYPLTYERASESGTMFGFLNVFLAALFVGDGLGAEDDAVTCSRSATRPVSRSALPA